MLCTLLFLQESINGMRLRFNFKKHFYDSNELISAYLFCIVLDCFITVRSLYMTEMSFCLKDKHSLAKRSSIYCDQYGR